VALGRVGDPVEEVLNPEIGVLLVTLAVPLQLDAVNRVRLGLTESIFEPAGIIGGIFAMRAIVFSTIWTDTFFGRRLAGKSLTDAPTSSITSIALSGKKRSLMYLPASSAAVRSDSLLYLTP